MSTPDLQITTDPGTVWRVSFAPAPWAWTPWAHATDGGLFNGRWDDQYGQFRTLYTGASLLGCFLEQLAKLRPSTTLHDELDLIEDPDHLSVDDSEAPPGAIGYDWLEVQVFGRATQTGRYCLITHSRTMAALAFAPMSCVPAQRSGYGEEACCYVSVSCNMLVWLTQLIVA